MNDSNQFSLGDALRQAIQKHGLENSMNEHRMKEAWEKTVGEYCYSHTESIRFSKGVLKVKINSAAVKQELLYAKTEVIEKINNFLEKELVETLHIY